MEVSTQDELEPFSDLEAWTEVTSKKNRKRQVRIDDGRTDIEGLPDPAMTADRSVRRPHRLIEIDWPLS